ncbi:hypothetical protein P9299_30950 [Bacillus cereus]|nr:hypothetical protein [Bacillus cereus]
MKLFNKLSTRIGVDVNKVVLDKDKKEQKKLERTLAKETMKVRTELIEK